MLNGSKNESKPNNNPSTIVDYRNAKYQGEISFPERLPEGIGMLLTIDYQFVIAKWSAGYVMG